MSALSYLFITKLKNRLKALLRNPGKLIYLICVLIFIISNVISGTNNPKEAAKQPRDISELIAGAIALYTLLFVLIAKTGFGSGSSLFSMADVNLLFTAPVNAGKVLFYGLLSQMGTSFLLCFAVLFQYSFLNNVYGINITGLMLIFLGCFIAVFLGQITALVLYAFTSADEKKKRVLKAAVLTFLTAFLLYLLILTFTGKGNMLQSLVFAMNTPFVRLLPVSGWLGSILYGALMLKPVVCLLGGLTIICYLMLLICLVLFRKLDYYEDVLGSTEIAHLALSAKKAGSISEAVPKNIKLGKTGFTKGWGADAFYHKHLIENRRARVFLLSAPMLVFAGITILVSFFMKSAGISAVFAFATYMQIFSVALGRINKELMKPYVYLVPEPAFQKLLQCLRESLFQYTAEALIIFVPISFILHLDPLTALLCIIARLSFAFLFTAGNLLVERIWGGGSSKALVIFLYMAVMIALSLPGVALGLLLSSLLSLTFITPTGIFFISLALCNIPVSLLVLYAVRNIMQTAS